MKWREGQQQKLKNQWNDPLDTNDAPNDGSEPFGNGYKSPNNDGNESPSA
jgi:hypothetical protein